MTVQTPDDVRDLEELRHSRDLVRKYSADGTLFAYADGDEHVVVCRGKEPGMTWTRRIDATVERPVAGQKRWTIPGNWERRIHSSRDDHARAIYYVPETDTHVKVDLPTNNYLVDAWYRVISVGDLTVDHVGSVGSAYEVRQLAREYDDEYDIPEADEDVAALRAVEDQWDAVETEAEMAIEWVRDEWLPEAWGAVPVEVDRNWQRSLPEMYFRPMEALNLSEFDTPDEIIRGELREAGLLPARYEVRVGLDSSTTDMEYTTRGLIEAGATNAAAVDYYMVKIVGMSQTEWAAERGVSQSTVSESVAQAVKALDQA
jgi:hypothetical protein